jgi:signal transduction histidine kinase
MHRHTSPLARLLGPRPLLLAGFVVLLAALVGAFGTVLVESQSQARRQSEQRFDARASLSAQLIGSLLGSSATSSEALAARTFSTRTVDAAALERLRAQAKAQYLALLDANGRQLAATSAAPARTAATRGAIVRSARRGTATLSDLLPARAGGAPVLLEYAVPFPTPYGRRILIEAIRASSLSTVLSAALGKTRTPGDGVAFVLDSSGRMVAGAGDTLTLGQRPNATALVEGFLAGTHGDYRYGGASRYFTSSPVGATTWHVVLTVPTNTLYPALAGSKRWLLWVVLGAFALAGLASCVFFRRALVRGKALANANEVLAATNATLEERVAERTAAAEERAHALARSNQELEHFSSVASHDLQEPLRKIRMFGDRLRERLGPSLPEEPADDLRRMQNAAERMQRLINDLLDYSRVTRRGREFESVDLGAVAGDVVGDLEARIVELDARVDLGELPTVEADAMQMHQLLQNLIGNALKFHRDDERPLVRVSSAAADDHCTITVEDNGIGFDERHAERIFTAFERLHGRSEYDGTGIGLSIARKIAWRHGGQITASGVPDRGATFTVTLPLAQNGHNGDAEA